MEYCWWLSRFSFLTCLLVVITRVADADEICDMNWFRAECERNEIIVITHAQYGRMKPGRCLVTPEAHIGCSADVFAFMDGLCSGKTKCDYLVGSNDLYKVTTCETFMRSYLDVGYECIEVAMTPYDRCTQSSDMAVRNPHGYISSYIAHEYSCGTMTSPWMIDALPGQTVNVSLTELAKVDSTNTTSCTAIGFLSDMSNKRNVTICRPTLREVHLYNSNGNRVQVQFMTGVSQLQSNFLLKYQVLGCADLVPPAFAWYKRQGDTATIGCDHREMSWHLKCQNSRWTGVVGGNCTEKGASDDIVDIVTAPEVEEEEDTGFLPKYFLFFLIIGVGVALVIVIIICMIIWYVRSRQQDTKIKRREASVNYAQQAKMYREADECLLDHRMAADVNLRAIDNSYRHTLTPHIWERPLPELPGQVTDPDTVREETVQAEVNPIPYPLPEEYPMPEGYPVPDPLNSMPEGYPVADPLNSLPKGYPVADPLNSLPKGYPVGDPLNSLPEGYPVADPLNSLPEGYPVADPLNSMEEGYLAADTLNIMPEVNHTQDENLTLQLNPTLPLNPSLEVNPIPEMNPTRRPEDPAFQSLGGRSQKYNVLDQHLIQEEDDTNFAVNV